VCHAENCKTRDGSQVEQFLQVLNFTAADTKVTENGSIFSHLNSIKLGKFSSIQLYNEEVFGKTAKDF
jgi:hypothetical protein